VVSLHQSRHVTISRLTYPEHAELLLGVEGAKSAGIRLLETDLSRAARSVELGKDAPHDAVEKTP
jgi:hypothetical protein